jgi:hypothetical protein
MKQRRLESADVAVTLPTAWLLAEGLLLISVLPASLKLLELGVTFSELS